MIIILAKHTAWGAADNLYRAFEDKFRGSHELIKERLQVYKPFLEVLALFDNKQAIDLGCGRGEWLDVLSDEGFAALGVDLDSGMLEACRERGYRVKHQDAIEALQELEDFSMAIVSGFHIAEHLPFEVLQILIQESLRVLKPGGLLILETPNPENIRVATANFYLDPTHIRPIPPQLLSFLPEHYGFNRTKVLRLQENKELHSLEMATLAHVIGGASPDYAVVAQKSASPEVLLKFDELFIKEYGLSLDSLLNKFEYRIANIEQSANEASARATQAEQNANEASARATQAEQHIELLLNSNSWKITAPLRKFADFLRWFKTGAYSYISFAPGSRPRRVLKSLVSKIISKINENPKIKSKLLKILNNFPKLKEKLKEIKKTNPINIQNKDLQYKNLSSKEKEIYNKLKNEIEKGKNR
jgi:O-antigen chain-terminating methyltransferase